MSYEIGAVRASASFDSAGFEAGVKNTRSSLKLLQGGFQETSREALRSIQTMGRAWDDGLTKAQLATRNQIDTLTGVDRANQKASASAKAWAGQLDRQSKSFDRLRASVDPLYASTKQYEAALQQADDAVRAGIVSQAEANRVVGLAADQYLGSKTALGAYGKTAQASTYHTANLAAQFNDIGVMLAAGQNPFMLAMQQGTQVSQVLNQMGSGTRVVRSLGAAFMSMISPVSLATIGIIAGGAALAQWGISALGAESDTRSLDDALDDLSGSLDEYTRAAATGADYAAYIADTFGAVTQETIQLSAEMQELRLAQVLLDAHEAATLLAGTFSGGWRAELARLEDFLPKGAFDDASEGAKAFAAALNEVRQAGDLTSQLEAVRGLKTQLLSAVGSVERMTAEQREFYRSILESEAALSRAANTAGVVSGEIGNASAQTNTWANQMAGVRAEVNAILASLASIGGGMISNAAKQAEIDALRAGKSIRAAAVEATRFEKELEFDARDAAATNIFEKLAVDAERFQFEHGLALDEVLDKERSAARERERIASKSGGSAKAASKSVLASLQQEITQRSKLLSLTGRERAQYEAILQVQGRLGKEASKVSAAQIAGLADSLVGLESQEAALQRVSDLQRQWSEEITRTAFEGGSLGDTVEGMLRDIGYQFAHSKIVVPITASVTSILGLDQLLLNTAGGGAVQSALGGGNGLLGGLVGSQAGGLLSGGGLLGNTFLGQIGQGVGGILSGGGLGSSFASLGGLASGSVGGLGAIGAALPALGIIAGVGVALSKAFSREYQFSGIRGNFDAEGFTGQGFDFHKGGAFRSNKTNYYDLDPELEALLDTQARALNDSIHQMADVLLLDKAILDGFVSDFVQVNTNQDQEKILADLTAELEKSGEKMAQLVLGSAEFVREGETALDTITRLSTGFVAVNDVMDLLGHRVFDVGLIGANAASELADAFGGLDALTTAANTYWSAFYSEAERQETTLRRLTDQFQDMGLVIPRSRKEFRDLVEGLDLTTERGKELYAQLLQISGAMDEVLPQVAQFTLEMTGVLETIGGEVGSMLDTARDNARITESAASLWYRTSTTLRDFMADVLNSDLSAATGQQTLGLNRSRFETAFELARGGDVEAARDIPNLAKALLNSELANASSAADYRAIAGKVQGQINLLAGIAELEGANQDVLTTLYEQQIDVLTSLGNFLQLEGLTNEQIEALDVSIQDLARDFDGTLAEFDTALGSLETAIKDAEMFSYDYLKERLKVTVDLLPTASIPVYLRELIEQSAEGITSHIDFVVRSQLPAPEKWLAINGASEHVKTISFLVNDAQFSQDMQDLAFGAAGVFRQTIQFIGQNNLGQLSDLALGDAGTFVQRIRFAAGAIPQPARDIVLNELDEVTRHINLLMGDTIPDELQRLALDQADRFRRVINIVAGNMPIEAVQDLALSDPARFQRALDFFVGKIPNARIQSLALDAAAGFNRVINVQAGSLPNNRVIELALATGSELRRNISLILRKDIDPETRRIVLAGNSELSRVVNVALDRAGSDREALLLSLGNIRDYALTVEASLSPNISDEVRKLVFEGTGGYAAMVEASLTQLSGAARRILLQQQGTYATNITASFAKAIDKRTRKLLLEANTTAIRGITIASAFAGSLSAEQRELLLEESTGALRTITARLNANGLSAFESLFLRQLQDSGSVTRTIRGRVWPDNVSKLGQSILRELGRTSGGYIDRNIRARLVAIGISELDRDLLDQLGRGGGSIDRNVRSKITANVTGKNNTLVFQQLGIGTGTIARNISSRIDAVVKDPADRAMLNILAHYGGWTNRAVKSWIHSTVSGEQNEDFLELLVDRNGRTDRAIRSWLHSEVVNGPRNQDFWDLLTNRGYWSNRAIRSYIETNNPRNAQERAFLDLLVNRGYWTTRAIRSRLESDAPSGTRNSQFWGLLTNSARRTRQVHAYMHSAAPRGTQNQNFYNLLTNSARRSRQVYGYMHSSISGTQNRNIYNQLVAGNGTTNRHIYSNFGSNVDNQDALMLRQLSNGNGSINRAINGSINLGPLSSAQRALLNSINGSATGKITLAGTYKFAPEEAFKSWFGNTTSANLTSPMNNLRGALDALRGEIAGQRIRAEQKQAAVADIEATAGAVKNQLGENQNWAKNLVSQANQLMAQTGTQLFDEHGNAAILSINPDGTINFNGAYAAGGNTQAFSAGFYGQGKLNDLFGRANGNIGFALDRLETARQQIYSLGGTPSFDGGGFTGLGSRSGGLDGKGGFMAMLHPRETIIDHTNPFPIFDNSALIAQIYELRRLVDESNRLLARVDNNTEDSSWIARKQDTVGVKVIQSETEATA